MTWLGRLAACWMMFALLRNRFWKSSMLFFLVQSVQFLIMVAYPVVVAYGSVEAAWSAWHTIRWMDFVFEIVAIYAALDTPDMLEVGILMSAHFLIKYMKQKGMDVDADYTVDALHYIIYALNIVINLFVVWTTYNRPIGKPDKEHDNARILNHGWRRHRSS